MRKTKLPDKPGVYVFGPERRNYLCRSSHFFKRRVASYFRKDLDPRIKEMIERQTGFPARRQKTFQELAGSVKNIFVKGARRSPPLPPTSPEKEERGLIWDCEI